MDEKYLDQKFDSLRDKIDESAEKTGDKIDELRREMNGRVRKLEIWRAYVIGIGTLIAFCASLLVKFLF